MVTPIKKSGPKIRFGSDAVKTTIVIPRNDYDRLTAIAAKECRAVTSQALYLIQRGLDKKKGERNEDSDPIT